MPFLKVKRVIENIFLHCSARDAGTITTIRESHLARGFSEVGYHYVILNGIPYESWGYISILDGQTHPGRRLDDDCWLESNEVGAHVLGRNHDSVGICMIGKTHFTIPQLISSKSVCLYLMDRFGLEVNDVLGHYEDPNTHKTCPNIPMDKYRDYLRGKLTPEELMVFINELILELYRVEN